MNIIYKLSDDYEILVDRLWIDITTSNLFVLKNNVLQTQNSENIMLHNPESLMKDLYVNYTEFARLSQREKAGFVLWALTCRNENYKIYLINRHFGRYGVSMIFFTDNSHAFSFPEDFDLPVEVPKMQQFIAIQRISKYASVTFKQ